MGKCDSYGMILSHRIHGAAIYGNMDPINIPPNVSIYTRHGSYGYIYIYIRILIMMCHTYNKNADSEYDSTNYAFLICEV